MLQTIYNFLNYILLFGYMSENKIRLNQKINVTNMKESSIFIKAAVKK